MSAASASARVHGTNDTRSPGASWPATGRSAQNHGRDLQVAARGLAIGHQQQRSAAGRHLDRAERHRLGQRLAAAGDRQRRTVERERHPVRVGRHAEDVAGERVDRLPGEPPVLRAEHHAQARAAAVRQVGAHVGGEPGAGGGAAGARCSGRRSPGRSARPSTPPMPLTRWVARLPKHRRRRDAAGKGQAGPGADMPLPRPAGARRPGRRRRRSPGTATSFTDTSNAAPASAARTGWSTVSSGPTRVTSSAAASAALPTSALARRCA